MYPEQVPAYRQTDIQLGSDCQMHPEQVPTHGQTYGWGQTASPLPDVPGTGTCIQTDRHTAGVRLPLLCQMYPEQVPAYRQTDIQLGSDCQMYPEQVPAHRQTYSWGQTLPDVPGTGTYTQTDRHTAGVRLCQMFPEQVPIHGHRQTDIQLESDSARCTRNRYLYTDTDRQTDTDSWGQTLPGVPGTGTQRYRNIQTAGVRLLLLCQMYPEQVPAHEHRHTARVRLLLFCQMYPEQVPAHEHRHTARVRLLLLCQMYPEQVPTHRQTDIQLESDSFSSARCTRNRYLETDRHTGRHTAGVRLLLLRQMYPEQVPTHGHRHTAGVRLLLLCQMYPEQVPTHRYTQTYS